MDGFLIETMLDLREALCALSACRDAADLRANVSMSFATAEKGGRTIMGNSAEECAGARLVGGCCGASPEHMRTVAAVLRDFKGGYDDAEN